MERGCEGEVVSVRVCYQGEIVWSTRWRFDCFRDLSSFLGLKGSVESWTAKLTLDLLSSLLLALSCFRLNGPVSIRINPIRPSMNISK